MLQRLLTDLDAAVPARCPVCHAWPAGPLCAACKARFAGPQPRCSRCALPVPEGVRECGRCLADPPPLHACHAVVSYGYPWSGLVAHFKFSGNPGWARVFAGLMRRHPGVMQALEEAELVLPLPLAPERLAQRGFNQSLQLARLLAPAKVDAGLLLRIRHTPAQSALDRRARIENVRGAFAPDPLRAGEVRGRRLVLVDDVMTSGASLHAAARVLLDGGAARVAAVVFARTDEAEA